MFLFIALFILVSYPADLFAEPPAPDQLTYEAFMEKYGKAFPADLSLFAKSGEFSKGRVTVKTLGTTLISRLIIRSENKQFFTTPDFEKGDIARQLGGMRFRSKIYALDKKSSANTIALRQSKTSYWFDVPTKKFSAPHDIFLSQTEKSPKAGFLLWFTVCRDKNGCYGEQTRFGEISHFGEYEIQSWKEFSGQEKADADPQGYWVASADKEAWVKQQVAALQAAQLSSAPAQNSSDNPFPRRLYEPPLWEPSYPGQRLFEPPLWKPSYPGQRLYEPPLRHPRYPGERLYEYSPTNPLDPYAP